MSSSKYPNADTSQERLAEIEGAFNDNAWSIGRKDVRDLLAMLQERQRAHEENLAWIDRRVQEPGLGQIVAVELDNVNVSEFQLPHMIICFGVSDTDEPWTWWYGLPGRKEGRGG